jgi:hypothetical protein
MGKEGLLQTLMVSAGRVPLSRLLVAAALLHLSLAVAVTVAGRYRLLPNDFDAQGIGISFAADSVGYLNECVALEQMLESGQLSAWTKSDSGLHVKLYSLSFGALGRIMGRTILSAEPVNLIYYLLILSLIFSLGRELFDRATGVVAAVLTGLWPSLLLHSTQLLRDPLFITLFLIIVFVCVSWITRNYSVGKGLLAAAGGGAASAVVWLVRSQMWEVLLCTSLLSAAFLVFRQLQERKLSPGNSIGAALLCCIVLAAPAIGKAFNLYSYPAERGVVAAERRRNGGEAAPSVETSAASSAQPVLPPGSSLPARVGFLRHKFLFLYPEAGSNIDTNVEFKSLADILLYLPRALMIGLGAPFPNMWFVPGEQTGIKGRLLSGFETLLLYLIEAAAAFAVWRRRTYLPSWLLLLISLTGLLALGLVVPNIAALYRMRYGFSLLLIILGAEGIRQLSLRRRKVESEL